MFQLRKSEKQPDWAATAVPPTWLAWPTLRRGGGQVKTAGALSYVDKLKKARAAYGNLTMAELRIETSGQYAGAVRVFVAGVMLGSIPHEQAENFRNVVSALNASAAPATCRAELETDEYLNVWLDARPEERPEDDPFLPPLSPFYVSLARDQAERLDAGLHGKAKNKRLVTVGRVEAEESSWILSLDDLPVGTVLNPPSLALEAARAAGFPLTCQARVLREQGKALLVMADLPSLR